MSVIETIKQSLQFFKPKNLGLFLLITLNAILLTYKKIFFKFWWLFLGVIVFDCGIEYLANHFDIPGIIGGGLTHNFSWSTLIIEASYMLLLFVVFLCALPSVEQRKALHILKYAKKFIYFLLFCTLAGYIVGDRFGLEIDAITGAIADFNLSFFDWKRLLLLIPGVMVASPLFVFLVAFMLNSDGAIKSVGLSLIRAIKMCVVNYPICLILAIFLQYLSQIWDWFIFYAMQIFEIPIAELLEDGYTILPAFKLIKYSFILFWPIPICFLINFYFKKIHEQYDLYFPNKRVLK